MCKAVRGAGVLCVCMCVGGGVGGNLCGRKWRLMIMKAMLLTTPQLQLCVFLFEGRGNVGVGEPILSPP